MSRRESKPAKQKPGNKQVACDNCGALRVSLGGAMRREMLARLALRDLLGFYDRFQRGETNWTAADVRRIAAIRELAAPAAGSWPADLSATELAKTPGLLKYVTDGARADREADKLFKGKKARVRLSGTLVRCSQ